MRPRENLKRLYLYYHNACDYKTYQSDDILQGAPTNKFT